MLKSLISGNLTSKIIAAVVACILVCASLAAAGANEAVPTETEMAAPVQIAEPLFMTLRLGAPHTPSGCLWQMPVHYTDVIQIHAALSVVKNEDTDAPQASLQFVGAYREGPILQGVTFLGVDMSGNSGGAAFDTADIERHAPKADESYQIPLSLTMAENIIEIINNAGALVTMEAEETGDYRFSLPAAPDNETAAMTKCIAAMQDGP